MSQSTVALGRPVGQFDVDVNGLARYSRQIEVPGGRGDENQPSLSFEYSQGAPNGVLGVGWTLGGTSAIRLGPTSLAYDGVNDAPSDFDPLIPRLMLDGNLLLHVQGDYFSPDAQYRTEIDSLGRTVSVRGDGFVVHDSTGRQAEYGTTPDSRTSTSDSMVTHEWRIKKQIDPFGNCVTFNYEQSTDSSSLELQARNVSYLSTIDYTSNENTGLEAKRRVTFEYTIRDDPIVQCTYGERFAWTRLLKAVHIGLRRDPDNNRVRSYDLGYVKSPASSASHISTLTEIGYKDGKAYSLDPTTFAYQGFNDPTDNFKQAADPVLTLSDVPNPVMAMNLNISGRGLADIACFSHNPSGQEFSLHTFLAQGTGEVIGHGSAIAWEASRGEGAVARLPFINREYLSKVFGADLNGDGRIDLVVPFKSFDNNVYLSISESVGSGFKDHRTLETDLRWTNASRFMAMDFTGRGHCEVVQMFPDEGKLSLQIYPSIQDEDGTLLKSGSIFNTGDPFEGTIDWLEMTAQETGARCLVRVWQENVGSGLTQLKVTTYSLRDIKEPSRGFFEANVFLVGKPEDMDDRELSVVSCDINADGTEDLVVCSVEKDARLIHFEFSVFLGDGRGGFTNIGNTFTKDFELREHLNEATFHVASFSGSQTPEIAYVGQETFSGDIVSFIAQGSGDGHIRSMRSARIASDLPFEKAQISSSDINGSGVSDLFIHSISKGVVSIMGAYNLNDPSDFMTSTTSPLGLTTDVAYAPLSDPTVYESSVKWDSNFQALNGDSNPILGAANLVVSSVTHHNDVKKNAIPYQSSLTKLYKGARCSRHGRGWQGFSHIISTNHYGQTEPVVVEEEFQQDFPLTNLKTKIDTSALAGPVLKSERVSFGHSFHQMGPWKIFRVDRLAEQTDMLDNGTIGRTIGKDFVPDSDGNILEQRGYEVQNGQLIHQSWERSTYTTINGINGLQTSKKFTSAEGNKSSSEFEEGDLSLFLCRYNEKIGTLEETAQWSSDVNEFALTKVEFDVYGNEVSRINSSGLKTMTTYDPTHQTFPIQIVYSGDDVHHSRLTAYDERTGLKTASRETNGMTACFAYDAFGRCIQSQVSGSQQPASEFLGATASIIHESMAASLATTRLDPQKRITFDQITTGSGSVYPCALTTLESNNDASGRTEVLDVINCTNVTHRQSTQHGEMQKSWKYWAYSPQGLQVLESFPMYLPSTVESGKELDFIPDEKLCSRTSYNVINQPVEMIRPGHHQGTDSFIVSRFNYKNGGATTQEQRFHRDGDGGVSDTLLSTISKTVAQIADKECITEVIDENGLKSTFVFDAAGQLISCRDAGGKTETRTYNSRGQIVTLNNPYQNSSNTAPHAIRRLYDIAGRLLAETNALGETTEYEVDCINRMVRKVGYDGRSVVYRYDENGLDSLTTATTHLPNSEMFETRVSYTYDDRGRSTKKSISFSDGTSYTSSVSYNWQDNVTETTLPNGTVVKKEWHGALLSSSDIVSPTTQEWNVKAKFSKYSPLDKPERSEITGSGFVHEFSHEHKYNEQGFPLSHSLTSNTPLVQNHYLYNGLDQLQRVHEFGSGQTIDYAYSGKRLSKSQSMNGTTTSYAYDDSGNLIARGGINLSHSASGIKGVENGESVFNVEYDGAGRMISRQTADTNLSFVYDSFGQMTSILDTDTNKMTTIIPDEEGNTIKRTKSDGSQEIFISNSYTIIVKPDGHKSIRYSLYGPHELLATITMNEASEATAKSRPTHIGVHYSDTKNNITHTFNATDPRLQTEFDYDDYGLIRSEGLQEKDAPDHHLNTYEENALDEKSGLLDFGARWYDPLVGRFATPDNITDPKLLLGTDGMNRYAFENNDPINHVDPFGHWSMNATWGVLAGAALIGLGLGIVALSGGAAAAPLFVLVAESALVSGGLSGIMYSFQNSNEDDSAKFWTGWGVTVGVNAVVGAITFGISRGLGSWTGASASQPRLLHSVKMAVDTQRFKAHMIARRLLLNGLLGGTSSVFTSAANRQLHNSLYGTNDKVWNVEGDFMKGFVFGVIAGAVKEGVGRYGDSAKGWFNKILKRPAPDKATPKIYFTNEFVNKMSSSSKQVGQGVGGSGMLIPNRSIKWDDLVKHSVFSTQLLV